MITDYNLWLVCLNVCWWTDEHFLLCKYLFRPVNNFWCRYFCFRLTLIFCFIYYSLALLYHNSVFHRNRYNVGGAWLPIILTKNIKISVTFLGLFTGKTCPMPFAIGEKLKYSFITSYLSEPKTLSMVTNWLVCPVIDVGREVNI